MKRTICFDFDGVIHSYTSGWKGVCEIPDGPVEGSKFIIDYLREAGYEVVVMSSRTHSEEGMKAVQEWLDKHDIKVDRLCDTKPPALVYIDDRGLTFDGTKDPIETINMIIGFKTWQQKGE